MKRLLIILIVLLSSCELVIDTDVPYDGQKIVVNAIQEPDSLWYVKLSGSRYILDPNFRFDPILFANVVIHKPDGTSEKLIERRVGDYYGATRPEPGSAYRITVDSEGYPSVEGEMKMPVLVDVINIEWDSSRADGSGWPGNYEDLDVPFKVTFTDPPGENNFYAVKVYINTIQERRVYGDTTKFIDTVRSYQQTYLRDPGISNDDQSEFPDKTFDGQTITLPFVTEFRLWGYMKHYETEVWLINMSEDYFKYTKSERLQSEISGDPFAQPAPVFSNMSNSLGIFSGMATDIVKFKAPK